MTDSSIRKSAPADSLQLTKAPGALSDEVKYDAEDSIEINAANKMVHLYGKARVVFENIELRADYIYINFATNTVFAFGKKDTAGNYIGYTEFKQGDQEFKVRDMAYNFKSKRGRLSQLVTREGESIIYGDKVKKDEFNNSYIRGAKYTTCDADHPHFFINASKLKIIPEKQVILGPANLVIEDVPTPGFIPFGFFPITKRQKSGVLIPTYGNSPDRGFFLRAGGYYFALNDKVHAELRGDIYTLGSWGLYGTTRYRSRYRYSGNLDVRYNYNKFLNATGELPPVSKDFFVTWVHNVDAKARPNTTFSARVNAGTSNALRFNSYNANAIVTNQLISSVSYSKTFGKDNRYNFSTNLRHDQNTITRDINLSLPELFFGMQRVFPFKRKEVVGQPKWYQAIGDNLGIQYSGSMRNDIRTKDTLLFTRQTLDTMRNGMSHNIPISTSFKLFKHFTLSPAINYTEYWYLKTTEKAWDPSDSTVKTYQVDGFKRASAYNASISLTTRVYGMFNFRSEKIKAIRHVLTPTVSMVFQPDFSDLKYGYYKEVQNSVSGTRTRYSIFEQGIFSGPGAGRQGRLDFSLINNLEMKTMKGKDTARREEKVKLLETFNINSSYNFFADSLKWSNIQVSARTTLFKVVQVQVNGNFDPYIYDSFVVGEQRGITRFDKFELNENGRLARLTGGNIALSASLNPQLFKKGTAANTKREKLRELNLNPNDFIDFDVPWNLTLNYTYNYSRPLNTRNVSQTFMFNGDVSLTKDWKVGFNSGYDFVNKQLSYTSFDIHRNLHCWEFSLNWIPFGFRTSYFFTIRVRSSVLQELKLTRRRDWFDQGAF